MSPSRIFHWVLVIVITLKIITGLYLYNPGSVYLPVIWVDIHYYLTYLLLGNFIIWGYYYLLNGYDHTLIIKVRHLEHIPVFLNYKLLSHQQQPFFGSDKPRQKLIYSLWIMLIMIEWVTGFCLYFQDISNGLLSLAGEVQRVRLYHFWGGAGFLATVPLHIYWALTEAPAKLQGLNN